MRTKRKEVKQPSLILTGDWHIRSDQPVCRTDDYFQAQAKVIQFICALQEQYKCPLIVAGDIFHSWKSSPFLIGWAIEHFPNDMLVVAGQHDLQNHNLDLYENTALNVLEKAGRVKKALDPRSRSIVGDSVAVYGYAWGEKPVDITFQEHRVEGQRDVLVLHIMTWTNKVPFSGCTADSAHALLRKLSGYDLIVTGDNHQPFVVEHEGRVLCNPGSMMQMDADQIGHKPRVYLWYTENNSVEPIYLPSFSDSISREHIERAEKRDERIEAFVSRLQGDFEVGLSFEKNLEEYFSKNKTKKEIKNLVMEAVEGECDNHKGER